MSGTLAAAKNRFVNGHVFRVIKVKTYHADMDLERVLSSTITRAGTGGYYHC